MRVNTAHAFHSAMMAPIEPLLEGLVSTFQLHPPATPYLSNVSGTWIRDDEATSAAHWAGHLGRPVRFHDALAELWKLDNVAFLEVGAGQMLGNLAAEHPGRPGNDEARILATIPESVDGREEVVAILDVMGRLWEAGVSVDWTGFWPEEEK
jgi:acyl transferase domain-containing protein